MFNAVAILKTMNTTTKRIGEGSGAKLPMRTVPSKVQRIGDTEAQRERDEQAEYLRMMERQGVLERGRKS